MVWITATDALELMNVRAQTLYANVSRGKIRAKRDTKDCRRSLYHRDDVLRLSKQHRGQRKVDDVAAQAMEWGVPVLPSAISTIRDGRLWYRGQDAVDLSNNCQLEDIANVLWEGAAIRVGAVGATRPAYVGVDEPGDPLSRGLMALALRCAKDLPTYGRSTAVLCEEAAGVLSTLLCSMFGSTNEQPGGSISVQIATAWQCPQAEPIIRQALVLLADHELNASTFATRVTISTGASLAAGVLTGLATLTGPLHGRAVMSLSTLTDAVTRIGAEAAVREWLQQGRPFPAFGHPLYPDGDPRASALLGQLPLAPEYVDLAVWVERLVGELPNVDFALAAMARAYGLPVESPLALFAAGRCVGWLAHALEQAESGHLIRPRARYIGINAPIKLKA